MFILAGAQSGKTSFGPHWLHRECQRAMDKLARGEPLGDFLAVTADYDLFQLKMLPEILAVFVQLLGIGYYWAGAKILELREGLTPEGRLWVGPGGKANSPMWGRIILRSAEAEAGLESTTAKAAWLDEVGQKKFTRNAWRAILRRLGLSEGRVLGTTTIYLVNWMKTDIYDRWDRHRKGQGKPGDEDYDVIQFDSTENPAFEEREFQRAKDSMPLWEFNMTHRGLYSSPAGLVYENFNTMAHVLDRFPIPKGWLWHWGHDFGSKNPAALAFAQDPGTGIFYACHEYQSTVGVFRQVEHLKKVSEGYQVVRRQGGSHQEAGWRGDYQSKGWPVMEPPINDVGVGISRIRELHAYGRIMVFSDLEGYIEEKTSYSYAVDAAGDPTNEIDNKSAFNLMDCERYILCGVQAEKAVGTGKPKSKHGGNWGAPRGNVYSPG